MFENWRGEGRERRKRGLRRVVVDWRMLKVARVFEILLWVSSVIEENVRLCRDGYELGMACDDENFDKSKERRNICNND